MLKVHSNLVFCASSQRQLAQSSGFCVGVTPRQCAPLLGCQPVLCLSLSVCGVRCGMGRLYWDETRVFISSSSTLAAILLVRLSLLLLHIQRRRFIGDTAADIPPAVSPRPLCLSVCRPPF